MQQPISQRALANTVSPILHNKPPVECVKCKARVRSREEHQLFFGVIRMAFDNWPERHKFQPSDAEHLRAWLLIEAGHYDTLSVDDDVLVADVSLTVKILKMFNDGRADFRLKKTMTGMEVRRARSVNGDLPAKDFRPIADKVYEIIKAVSGITPEIYKANKGKSV